MKDQIPKLFDDEQALTERDAAKFLGFSCATLARWRVVKEGPRYVKVSKTSIRYRLKDLKDWLKKRVVNTNRKGVKNGRQLL